MPIGKKLFQKKPKCVSKWYGININYEDEDLIPIPIGLANDYSPKNLLINDFLNTTQINEKKFKLYVNNRRNTNHKERDLTYTYFKNKDWCKLDEPTLDNQEYKNNLNNHLFILCPEGNGLDTHRIWESIYLGSVPVVKKHITHKSLDNLRVLKVDKFEDINLETLKQFEENNTYQDMKKIKIDYWIELIRSGNNEKIMNIEISEDKNKNLNFNRKKNVTFKFESRLKVLRFYFRKIKKIFFFYNKEI